MEQIATTIIVSLFILAMYLFGKDARYREAIQKIAEGNIHLTISTTKRIVEINPAEEKN